MQKERLKKIAGLLGEHCNDTFYVLDGLIYKAHGFGGLSEPEALQMLRSRIEQYMVKREEIDFSITELTTFLSQSYIEERG